MQCAAVQALVQLLISFLFSWSLDARNTKKIVVTSHCLQLSRPLMLLQNFQFWSFSEVESIRLPGLNFVTA